DEHVHQILRRLPGEELLAVEEVDRPRPAGPGLLEELLHLRAHPTTSGTTMERSICSIATRAAAWRRRADAVRFASSTRRSASSPARAAAARTRGRRPRFAIASSAAPAAATAAYR